MPVVPRAVIASASEPPLLERQHAPAEGCGFGRTCRLLTAAQFAEVFSARQVLRSAHFALHYRHNGLHFARLGLVIPKKQARTAILRNTVKRQAREAFRHRRPALQAIDVVLRLAQPVGKKSSGTACEPAAWRAEIDALLDRLCRKTTP